MSPAFYAMIASTLPAGVTVLSMVGRRTGGASSTPAVESNQFQSLIVNNDNGAFNWFQPGVLMSFARLYVAVRGVEPFRVVTVVGRCKLTPA